MERAKLKRQGVNGKQKGASFERLICGRLSLWASNMTRSDVFWRSAMSGGRATLGGRKARGHDFSAQVGDISAIHRCGHALLALFAIECKTYKDLQIQSLIFGLQGSTEIIWEKPRAEAWAIGREPLVIAKENRRLEVAMTTERGMEILRSGCVHSRDLPLHAHFPQAGLYVVQFKDILTDVRYEVLEELASKGAQPSQKKLVMPERKRLLA